MEADCYNFSANLFQPESGAKGEVKLNHQGDVHIHVQLIINQSSSKYFEIRTIPLQIYENFDGGLVDTLKRHNFRIYLQPV